MPRLLVFEAARMLTLGASDLRLLLPVLVNMSMTTFRVETPTEVGILTDGHSFHVDNVAS